MLVASIVLGGAGSVILIDSSSTILSIPRFLFGFAVITVAFPMGRNVTISIYSAVLGDVEQGFYMGLMLAVGAIPRALGPFWAIKSLQLAMDAEGKFHTYLEFETAAAFFALGLVLTLGTINALVPFEEFHGLNGGGGEGDLEGAVSEATPLVAAKSPAASYQSPGAIMGGTPGSQKRLKERRNSNRPSLVAQIQGEFPSSSNISGMAGSFQGEKGGGMGGRAKVADIS
jgi:hypothetical protein